MKKEHFGTYYCGTSPFPLQAIPIVWYIVLIFSSFGSRSICRIFGWRIVFRFLSIFILLGAFVSMTSSNVYIFILGRVFASIGIGLASQDKEKRLLMLNVGKIFHWKDVCSHKANKKFDGQLNLLLRLDVAQVIPRYNTEIAFSERRKIVDVVFQVSILFGVALGNILNDMATEWPWGWRMLVGFEGVPAIPLIIVSFLIIDPPKSYMERGITELAKASLISLRGSRLGVLEFSTIIQQVIDSESDFKLIMSSRYRPHLIIAIFSQVLNICSGSMVIVLLMPETVLNLGYLTEESVLWNSIVMSSSTIVGAILTLFLVGRIGRRIMTMTFFFFAGFSMALLGILFLVFMKPGFSLERTPAICATILICFVMCGSSGTLGPRGWMSEGFPPSMDWVGSIASSCTNLFLTLVLAQVIELALCYIRNWVFIIFSVFNLLGGFFVYLFLPETTGRSSGIELSKHRIWRRYVQNDEIGV
ncbi:hypothetical protein IFM89_039393 [Coptis chinensis]|uniref:Major facilitator superfamily (MFS) profile domain-containing protein n=1 Tax=Coptis chinensis TaxID=261450 RepID=A0A835M108_9MAGN|nr:hypothetical protein IFM89_039393 [Coptis chinensis]